MALIYSEKYAGYIADVPNIHFIRCDGRVFYFEEVNSASVTNNANSQTITGGQGNYPLAFIETDKTLELTFASSQFSLEMFEMANATEMVEGDCGAYETKRYDVGEDLTITIPYEVQEETVQIRGLKEAAAGDTVNAGTFTVAITKATADTAGSTVITLAEGDVTEGDQVRVSYNRRVINAKRVVVKTNTPTARGAAEIEYPVYSAGTDCTESAIKGKLRLKIHRCRVTALPGFDTSYKTAATNSVTFAAMDAKRADGQVYELVWEEYDADGNAITKSEGEVDWTV